MVEIEIQMKVVLPDGDTYWTTASLPPVAIERLSDHDVYERYLRPMWVTVRQAYLARRDDQLPDRVM